MSDTLPPASPNETAPNFTSLETRVADVFDRNNSWLLVAGGICVAGAVYPAIFVAIYAVVFAVFVLTRMIAEPSMSWAMQWVSLLPAAIFATVFAAAAAAIGAVWTGFLALFIVPAFYLFARSLQLQASIVWLGAICGGLVGFVAVLPFFMSMLLSMGPTAGSPIVAVVIFGLFGPALATVVGQLGGAWGGRMSLRRRAKLTHGQQPPADPVDEPLLRFRIRHLLWITVWVALLLTAIRLSGVPYEVMLPTLGGWLVYQAATLYAGWSWFQRVVPWWQARRST